MQRRFILLPALLLSSGLLIGCGDDSGSGGPGAEIAQGSAEEAVRGILGQLEQGQPDAIWTAMPESYQTDVNELVQTFGQKMDPGVWKTIMGLLQEVAGLLETKGGFLANHPLIAAQAQGNPAASEDGIKKMAGLLQTIIDSVSDLESLKTFDGAEYLRTSGAGIMQQADALNQMAPSSPGSLTGLASLKNVTVETVSTEGGVETLKITGTDGTSEQIAFTQVEGKWIPQDMALEWKRNMQQARTGLDSMDVQIEQMRMQIPMVSAMVSGALVPLKNAETQEQFNTALGGIMNGLGPMMGGGMSPFGGGTAAPETSFGGSPLDEGDGSTEQAGASNEEGAGNENLENADDE